MALMESLLNLYRVDGQVRSLRNRLETARRYLQTQQRLLAEARQNHEELSSRKRQLQAHLANLETETAVVDERLEKLRNELNSSSTNKQYSAVLSEMTGFKDQRNALDEQMLAHMEKIETIEAELTQAAQQIEDREKMSGIAEAQLAERQKDVGERLAELESEREVAAKDVPAEQQHVFDEMADCYDGEAMASIEEIDKRHREYACGACHMHLPFERLSLLLTSSGSLVRCTACSRILYVTEELRESMTAAKK